MLKIIPHVFLFTLLMVLAIGCTTQNPNHNAVHRQWMLIEYKNFDPSFLTRNNANLDFSATKSPKDQYVAYMGCNKINLNAEFKPGGKIRFSQPLSTLKYCGPDMQLEDSFVKDLPDMVSYKLDGHYLTLTGRDGAVMKFVAADWD